MTAPNPQLMHQISRVRRHLRNGGVIAYATESCYGLGCDPRNYRAVQRILRLKGRPQKKGLILIASHLGQLRPYLASLSAGDESTLQDYWPGPFTFVLPSAPRTPRWLSGRHDSIAVRVTAHPDAAALCDALDMALVSTSANRSGHKPLKTQSACKRAFGDRVLALPGRVGKRKRPSTIMDLRSGKVLRK
jgi:L-threonylcarbamoyladenylate synthase